MMSSILYTVVSKMKHQVIRDQQGLFQHFFFNVERRMQTKQKQSILTINVNQCFLLT